MQPFLQLLVEFPDVASAGSGGGEIHLLSSWHRVFSLVAGIFF